MEPRSLPSLLGVDACSAHPLQLAHVTLTENGFVLVAHQLLHFNDGAGVGVDADGSVHPLQLAHVTLTENGCVLAAHQLLHFNGGAGVGGGVGAGVGVDADGSVHPLQLVHVTLTENGCVLAAHQLLHINTGAGGTGVGGVGVGANVVVVVGVVAGSVQQSQKPPPVHSRSSQSNDPSFAPKLLEHCFPAGGPAMQSAHLSGN